MNILTFKSKVGLLMSIGLVISLSALAQSKNFEWPNTPASIVFQQFIEAYNTGDEGAIRAFSLAHYRKTDAAYIEDKVDYWMDFYARFGQIEPHAISINEPYDLEVWVQGKVSMAWAAPEFLLDQSSNKIRGTAMLQGTLPEGLKIGSKNETVMLNTLKTFFKENESKGLFQGTVLLQKGDEVLINHAYGYKNREDKIKNTADTRFALWSISKPITAVACLQLVQRGVLDLDVPIAHYLPELPKHISDQLTIRNMLSHSSGYELDGIDGFRAAQEKTRSMQEVYELQLKYLPKWANYSDFNPSQKYDYSNDGFDLAAIIIEKITGMKFEDYLKQYIFDVSGMTDTSFDVMDSAVPYAYDLAAGGLKDYSAYYPYQIGKISGASGLFGTTRDLQLFFNTLFRTNKLLNISYRGMLFGLISKINKATNMHDHSSFFTPENADNTHVYNGYGLGMFINYDCAFNIGHSGSASIGASTELKYFPDSDYLLIVLCNNANGAKNSYNFFKSIIPIE